MTPTPDQIAELKTKHGDDLHLLTFDGVSVVAKRPGKMEYRKFKRATLDDRRKEDAAEGLARDCIVWPDGAGLTEIFGTRPGLVDTFAGELVDLAGTARDCQVVPL